MREILRIFAIVAAMAIVACGTDHPAPEPPTPPTPDDGKVEGIFHFANEKSTFNKLGVDITCDDPDMEYVIFLAEKKYFLLNQIDTRDELLMDDCNYISSFAKRYGISAYDFLKQQGWLAKGDKEGYMAVDLYPGTEYVVYCYGVEFSDDSFSATTDVCYTTIRTSAPEMQSVEFDIECSVAGNVADIRINPADYDGLYYCYMVPEGSREYLPSGEEVDNIHLELFGNISYDSFVQRVNNGVSAEQFCMRGETTLSERVKPNTTYMVVAFAVSDDRIPMLCSEPAVTHFTSGDLAKSDLTLDIKVTDITPYNAQLTVTPSNDEETYACVFISREQQPKEVSDYDQMMMIIQQFTPGEFTGTISETLTPLMPSTEYVVLAFGLDTVNYLPTTDLYEVHFTSGEASEGKINITAIELVKVFDAEEIVALDPSYAGVLAECECVAIVEAKTNAPCDTLYFWWYETWMKVEYGNEAFLEDLLMYDYANNPEVMDMYYSLDADDTFFFAGIAEDENGNLSDIFYGEDFVLSKDMTSPAEEFLSIVAKPSKNRVIFKR